MSSDCRTARVLLDRLEIMREGAWGWVAAAQAWNIARVLVRAVQTRSGPQPELAAWLSNPDAPAPELDEAFRELRAALGRGDVMVALVEAHGLARRLTMEIGNEAGREAP
jgi:hypothetical protein